VTESSESGDHSAAPGLAADPVIGAELVAALEGDEFALACLREALANRIGVDAEHVRVERTRALLRIEVDRGRG
jgi:hypothetical protein